MVDEKEFRECYCWACDCTQCNGPEDLDARATCDYWLAARAKDIAEKFLPKDKYEHAKRVASYSLEVSKKYPLAEHIMAYIVAWLHDVVEDSDYPLCAIEMEFGEHISKCIELLTHKKEEYSYPEYIDHIFESKNWDAIVVKHADMKDHLAQKETLTPKLKEKYFEVIDRFI